MRVEWNGNWRRWGRNKKGWYPDFRVFRRHGFAVGPITIVKTK